MCDQCQYRTVNKHNFENHLEDHKNGLVFLGSEGDDEQASSSTRKRLAVAKQAKPKTQAYTVGPVSAVDLVKLQGVEGLASNELNPAQLIYSALNAMSQQQQQVQTGQLATDASMQQASSVSSTSQDGMTTHTITLQLGAPAGNVMPHDGTSSAGVEISNPVVFTVNQGHPEAISLITGSEPAAAAGEVHAGTETHQTQQVTDIVQQAIEGLEVLHQGDASQTHILQPATARAPEVQGLEVLQSNQVLHTVAGFQNYETVQVLQPHIANISADGQIQITSQNIVAPDTGQIVYRTDGSDFPQQN